MMSRYLASITLGRRLVLRENMERDTRWTTCRSSSRQQAETSVLISKQSIIQKVFQTPHLQFEKLCVYHLGYFLRLQFQLWPAGLSQFKYKPGWQMCTQLSPQPCSHLAYIDIYKWNSGGKRHMRQETPLYVSFHGTSILNLELPKKSTIKLPSVNLLFVSSGHTCLL